MWYNLIKILVFRMDRRVFFFTVSRLFSSSFLRLFFFFFNLNKPLNFPFSQKIGYVCSTWSHKWNKKEKKIWKKWKEFFKLRKSSHRKRKQIKTNQKKAKKKKNEEMNGWSEKESGKKRHRKGKQGKEIVWCIFFLSRNTQYIHHSSITSSRSTSPLKRS